MSRQATTDYGVGVVGITAPWWLEPLQTAGAVATAIAAIAGAVLVLFRLAMAIREWRRK